MKRNRVGVLALQGGYALHARSLTALGIEAVEVRDANQLAGADGLILPGGESSVQLALLARFNLEDAVVAFARTGKPMLATCAGLILVAAEVSSPSQRGLGFLDVAVVRNAYGRQRHSFEAVDDAGTLPLVFIRAPRIARVGAGVEVLATFRGEAVLVRQGAITGAAFHPELTGDLRVHRAVFGGEDLHVLASSPGGAPGPGGATTCSQSSPTEPAPTVLK